MQFNRRQKPDTLIILINSFSIICWLMFLAALILFHYARPELEYGIIRYFQLSVREHWLAQPKHILIALLYVCSILSFITMLISKLRSRRKTDSKGFNLLSLLIICICFILVLTL